MDTQYVYTKLRSEFGKQCVFTDRGPELIDNYPSTNKYLKEYIYRNPIDQAIQCSFVQAEHEVNTERAKYVNNYMNHTEGGWPKDINPNDEDQPKRYRRKIEKDESYCLTVMQLAKSMENCILQNNAVNIYNHYFNDLEPAPLVEKSSSRTVNVYQDQCAVKRPVTHISWSPDEGSKLAITYCNMDYQNTVLNQSPNSFIWTVENPNTPNLILKPPVPMVCLEYNLKDPNSLVGGMLNGQVSVWDTRKGPAPVEVSEIEVSHRDPIRDILWIASKSGSEFFTGSSDGQCKWWDIRKLGEPLETLTLHMIKQGESQDPTQAQGVSCLEYEPTIPTRFMVGTEHGYVLSGNRKGKQPHEKITAKFNAHLGPVYAVQRNPGFVKNFLTVGDWTARIWSEDTKDSAIIWTNYHKALLTGGAWSPTRLSVFFLTRDDGVLDVWDIIQNQKSPSLSVKVCDEPLTCIRTHEGGRLVSVGNKRGTTYLVEFSENLSITHKNDKAFMTQMFERETHREKIMEARLRELKLKTKMRGTVHGSAAQTDETGEKVDAALKQAEDEFKETIHNELYPPEKKSSQTEVKEPPPEAELEAPPQVPEPEPVEEEPAPPPTPEPAAKGKKGKKGKGKGKKTPKSPKSPKGKGKGKGKGKKK